MIPIANRVKVLYNNSQEKNMARDKQYYKGQIIGKKGQVLSFEARSKNLKQNKYFAVVAECGHAGSGFFVPILFPVAANSKEDVIDIIKATPRVKNGSPQFILGLTEITLSEFDLLNHVNYNDDYLKRTSEPHETRKIMLSNYAEVKMKNDRGEKLTGQEKVMLKSVINKKLLLVEDYPDNRILQKAFAPRMVRDKLVYPSKVNMNELLYDYYVSAIKYFGIKLKNTFVLNKCLQIFGLDNEFGVKLDTKKNTITFTNKQGRIERLPILETTKDYILEHQETRLIGSITKSQKPTIEDILSSLDSSTDTTERPSSAVDKFNMRLAKMQQAKSPKEETEVEPS